MGERLEFGKIIGCLLNMDIKFGLQNLPIVLFQEFVRFLMRNIEDDKLAVE